MALPGLGFTAALGFGEELTYGIPGDRNKFLEFDSESIEVEERQIRSPSVFSTGWRTTRAIQGAVRVAGDVVFSPQFEGWYKILKHTLGTVVSTSPDPTNAPTVRQHVFTPGNFLPTGLTLEIQKDPTTVAGGTFLITGAKITSLALQVSSETLLQVTASIIARQMQSIGTSTTPVFSTKKLIPGTIGAVTWGAVAKDVSDFNVTMSNNLTADRQFLGSRFLKEPVRNDKFLVNGSFTSEFQSLEEFNDFRDDDRKELILDFVGDQIGSTAFSYRFKIRLPISRLVTATPNVSSPGPIMYDITFESYRSDSDVEIEITVVNEEVTI